MRHLRLLGFLLLVVGCPSVFYGQQLTPLFSCPGSTPSYDCGWSHACLFPDGEWVLFTDHSAYGPVFEYYPNVVMKSRQSGQVRILGALAWAMSGSLSPDGRRVAYRAGRYFHDPDGIPGLYVQDIYPGSPPVPSPVQTLVLDDPLADMPVWSPDGNFLAYVGGDGGIWVVPASGGSASQLVSDGRSPSWGPGNQIVFERGGDLWSRDALGMVRPLTETPYEERTPSWSPAGDWIAFSSDEAGPRDLWVMHAGGGTRVRLTTQQPGAEMPTWSSDGSTLLFVTLGEPNTIWMATDLPDFTTPIDNRSWGNIKDLYR